MRVLLIDPGGFSLDIALRMQDDGHEVILFIKDTPKTDLIGKGMVEVVRDFRPHLDWADLIVMADNVLYTRELDVWRAEHDTPFIGPCQNAAAWELDRSKGMGILELADIPTPAFQEFSDFDKAIAYVKKENRRFVSKPSGDADKALSYVAKSPADLVYMLERWKQNGKFKNLPFILQDFMAGTEMAVGGWFGPHGWNQGWCENFEFKKLMDGDMGVATGEQGTVMRIVRKSKLADKVLKPVTEALHRLDYVGYVDVNCIIDDAGNVWPLEFTMRPGWPCFNIQMALNEGDTAEWLLDLAMGRDARNWVLDRIAVGVVMSIPDYPYSHITRKEVQGVPLYGLTPGLWKHAHLCEIMMGEAPASVAGSIITTPMPVSAGDYLLVMTAVNDTVQQARDQVYRRLKRLTVPNSPMYRTDIGERLRKQLPAIQTQGFATGMVYSTPPPN